MTTSNQQLADGIVRHQVFSLRRADIAGRDIYSRFRARYEISISQKRNPGERLRAYERAYRRGRDERREDWNRAEEAALLLLLLLARSERRFILGLIREVSPTELELKSPADATVEATARSGLHAERKLGEWFRDTRIQEERRLRGEFRSAAVNERDPSVTRHLRRTAKDVLGLIRTLSLGIAADIREIVFDQNQELFSEEVYSAILDNRTTAICRSLDDNVYAVGRGPQPPVHFNCRSVRLPVFNADAFSTDRLKQGTEVALLRELGMSHRSQDPDRFSAFARRRIPQLLGKRPRRRSYASWLRSQPAVFQDDVLGNVRGVLFRRGGLSLDRFVDDRGQEFTLSDLARSEAAAFRATGLDPSDWV